jgi:hypothetical protein
VVVEVEVVVEVVLKNHGVAEVVIGEVVVVLVEDLVVTRDL